MELAKRLAELASLTATEKECYSAGWSSVVDGPNTDNCSIRFFGTREGTRAWERGAADARKELEKNSG